jgi:cytochrome c oxidase subunit 2
MFGIPLFPERASTIANEVDALYFFLVGLSVVMSVLIATLVVAFAIKFRRRHKDEVGAQVHGGLMLELAWTVVPFLIAMVIFFWGAKVYFVMASPPAETLNIYIVGKQWMWKVQHTTGQREINELHVPVGRPVKLIMTSEDVIHNFSIPAMRIKADVIPGRFVQIWFEPTKPGTYQVFCAEYCGTQHSGMIGQVVVMESTAYQTWMSGGAAEGSLASTGEKLFADLACNTCHRPDSRGRGPVLQNVFGHPVQLHDGTVVTADENYLRESILTPAAKLTAGYQPVMPAFQGLVTEEQLLALIEYIKSLSTRHPNAGAALGAPPQQDNANR